MKHTLQPEFVDFYLPFGGKLESDNRWVKLAALVPWDQVEESYSHSLSDSNMGAPPLSGRIAFGAMIIKERLGATDEETVEQIAENPYLQCFLGYREWLRDAPFDASMMVHFRSRFAQDDYDEINAQIIPGDTNNTTNRETETEAESEKADESEEKQAQQATPDTNSGKLLIDASVTPADITYPTDLKLLNAAREKAEHLIDLLHAAFIGRRKKPRSYRKEARKDFLATIELKRPGAKKMRCALGRQLRYLKRDLRHLDELVQCGADLGSLKAYDYRCLLVIHEIYRQQLEMWRERKHRVDDRIVSLSQPWVRPIVRGKASAKVEFGAKISIGVVNGYVSLHRMHWDANNENADLISQAEAYREACGHYPESIHADQIYRTRANRAWCKERGIRLSGPPLGRPPKDNEKNEQRRAAAKAQMRADEIARIPVEGKFGNAKRGGSLSRVMAKLRGAPLI